MSALDTFRFQPGMRTIPADVLNEMVEICRQVKNLHVSPPLEKRVAPGAILISSRARTAASTTRVVKLTSGGPGDTYTGDVYGDGPDEPATEDGVTVEVLGMAAGETAVTGRPILATLIGETYYAQVPLWQ